LSLFPITFALDPEVAATLSVQGPWSSRAFGASATDTSRASGMAQVVQRLPGKQEVLSSNNNKTEKEDTGYVRTWGTLKCP
jgi:hypothetical protein